MGPAFTGPFADFLAHYGDLALVVIVFVAALGAPLPITGLLVSLGALSAAPGGPNLALIGPLALIASVAGDVVIYAAGWKGGQPLLRWARRDPRARLGRALGEAETALKRYGAPILFLSRFLFTAIAGPITLLVGATRLRRRAFAGWDVAGKIIYVAGNLLVGRLFGAGLGARTSGAVFWWGIVAVALLVPLATALAARFVRARLPHVENEIR
jgi:membrane protein DedA with SNARE-associated domain